MVQALRQQNLGSDAVATCRDVFAASTPATGAVSVFAHRVFLTTRLASHPRRSTERQTKLPSGYLT